jgi:hypothetical protein
MSHLWRSEISFFSAHSLAAVATQWRACGALQCSPGSGPPKTSLTNVNFVQFLRAWMVLTWESLLKLSIPVNREDYSDEVVEPQESAELEHENTDRFERHL